MVQQDSQVYALQLEKVTPSSDRFPAQRAPRPSSKKARLQEVCASRPTAHRSLITNVKEIAKVVFEIDAEGNVTFTPVKSFGS